MHALVYSDVFLNKSIRLENIVIGTVTIRREPHRRSGTPPDPSRGAFSWAFGLFLRRSNLAVD